MVRERKLTFRELVRWLKGMKGLDNYQLETFVNNTLYILDTLYYTLQAFQKGEKIPKKIKNSCFHLLHPEKDRLRLSEIVRYTNLSKRTVWKHLKRLCDIGLVKNLGKGYYALANEMSKKNYEEYLKFKEGVKILIQRLIKGYSDDLEK